MLVGRPVSVAELREMVLAHELVKASGVDLGPSGLVSASFAKSTIAKFASEVSTTKDQPLDYKRATQSAVNVKDEYFKNVRGVVQRVRDEGKMRTAWPRPDQWFSMDEQPFGNVDDRSVTVGEKQRVALTRLGVLPRNFTLNGADRSSKHYSIQWFTSPNPVKPLPFPPVIISQGVLMNRMKVSFKRGPTEPLELLSDLPDEWCAWTNEWGGAECDQFAELARYMTKELPKIGLGPGNDAAFFCTDHHNTRDDPDALDSLEENNINLCGSVAHGSHWGQAPDCGWHAFANACVSDGISQWYEEAEPGQVMSDADFNGIIVKFYERCTKVRDMLVMLAHGLEICAS